MKESIMNGILCLVIFLMLVLSPVKSIAGTDPSAFLNIGIGGRAMGLGGAFTSVSNDTTAMYWNPAGLGKINRISVAAMGQSLSGSEWETIKDITPQFQFVGLTFPVNSFRIPFINNPTNTFGIGMISSNLDNIPYTSLDASGNIIRDTLADRENAYLISYGFPFSEEGDGLFFGATFKYIMQQFSKISDATASGYDLDAGLIYTTGKLNLGLVMQRGVVLTWANGHRDTGPLTTKFGVSNEFPLSEIFSVTGSADLVQRQGQPLSINAGAELGYSGLKGKSAFAVDGLFLRMGIDGFTIEDRYGYRDAMNNNINLNFGLGTTLSYNNYTLQLDYVLGSYRLGNKSRFSVIFYF